MLCFGCVVNSCVVSSKCLYSSSKCFEMLSEFGVLVQIPHLQGKCLKCAGNRFLSHFLQLHGVFIIFAQPWHLQVMVFLHFVKSLGKFVHLYLENCFFIHLILSSFSEIFLYEKLSGSLFLIFLINALCLQTPNSQVAGWRHRHFSWKHPKQWQFPASSSSSLSVQTSELEICPWAIPEIFWKKY